MNYWSYPFNPSIKPEFRLDLNQGNTPLQSAPTEITELTNLKQLTFKREDLNPHGSFKDRALAYQISYLHQNHAPYCVLSSSGNAAISCSAFAQQTNIKPIILVSPDIPTNKLSQIIHHKPYLLIKSTQARRLANYISKKYHVPILNPSKDIHAAIGFETLGQEISRQNPTCQAIFSYSTSGASLIGINNFYNKNYLKTPRLFACQINKSQTKFFPHANSNQITQIIKNSDGNTITIDIDKSSVISSILQKYQINSSFEGITAIHACIKFSQQYPKIRNATVIISGCEHETLNNLTDIYIENAETKNEIDNLLNTKNITS